MANRLGLFVAALVFGAGLLLARPWIPDQSDTGEIIRAFFYFAVIAYAFIRGVGWVFSGK
jgi:hypothetical protein